jgi:hypothetical protein
VDEARLARALTPLLGRSLAEELTADFVKIRRDYATKTLERASPGKFVETLVQCLQYIDVGKYDAKLSVDAYLSTKVEQTGLSEGLRICAARIGRSMYTLRNKRNIAHKNEVDSNSFDLAYIHQGAAWVMAELIRNATGVTMQEAGALIELVQAPVGTLVEEIDGMRLIHADVSVRVELLILLHSHYPNVVSMKDILSSLSRRSAGTVKNRLGDLHDKKLAHGNAKSGYRLTQAGHAAAVTEIEKFADVA